MAKYGLIGKNISYSFSKEFFTQKFEKEHRKHSYENYDIQDITEFPSVLKSNPKLKGLNVTIPYKEEIIPYLDLLDKEAEQIGAVNTIKVKKNGKLKGFNTDHYGFARALEDFYPFTAKTALILGTGGSSKAIEYVLKTLDFDYQFVSRNASENQLSYSDLDRELITYYKLIINCTPLGTYPNTKEFPAIPYQYITDQHMLFDLIYNPSQTEFLKMGFLKGAKTSNGLKMLEQQALKAWSIWRS